MAVDPIPNEHPNAQLVRRAHQAFKTADIATVHELFDYDNMEWTVTGRSPAAGTTVGMDGVMKNFGHIMRWTQGTYDAVPVDYLASDRHAVAMARVSARRADGATLDMPEAVVFDIENGKLVRAQHMAYDEHAWDEFFTGMPTSTSDDLQRGRIGVGEATA